jgi:molybdopterin-guanine dinucleotide biosynthesis protein A
MGHKNIVGAKNISGVILAGGANSRFNGITKANVVIGGKTIIDRILVIIEALFSEIIIVTNTPQEFRKYSDFKIVSDVILNKGPLGGIHAALKATDNDAVFVFAGDMPVLNANIISRLIDSYASQKYEVMIPSIGNNIEPLHSIYNKSVLPKLEEYLSDNNDYAVRDFIKSVKTGYLNLENSEHNRMAFSNINSPEDLLLFERLLSI